MNKLIAALIALIAVATFAGTAQAGNHISSKVKVYEADASSYCAGTGMKKYGKVVLVATPVREIFPRLIEYQVTAEFKLRLPDGSYTARLGEVYGNGAGCSQLLGSTDEGGGQCTLSASYTFYTGTPVVQATVTSADGSAVAATQPLQLELP